jgi:hypothetical protein
MCHDVKERLPIKIDLPSRDSGEKCLEEFQYEVD